MIERFLRQGHEVQSIYVEVSCNWEKIKREKAAIQAMLPYFKNYSFRHLGETTVSPLVGGELLSLKQPLLWLTGLAYAANCTHDQVAIGYVMGDDACSYREDIRAVWKSMSRLMYGNKIPTLVFPLTKYSKIELWNTIPVELRNHVTWCESGGAKDFCGDCHSCKRAEFEGIISRKKIEISIPAPSMLKEVSEDKAA